jgi:hypothetical protein
VLLHSFQCFLHCGIDRRDYSRAFGAVRWPKEWLGVLATGAEFEGFGVIVFDATALADFLVVRSPPACTM